MACVVELSVHSDPDGPLGNFFQCAAGWLGFYKWMFRFSVHQLISDLIP
jgi:hypothetical protein